VISLIKFLTLTAILSFISTTKFYANDVILTGNANGLVVTSKDHGKVVNELFSVERMTPGDIKKATVLIKNTDNNSFKLSVEVKNAFPKKSRFDASEEFIITIKQDGKILEDFPKRAGKYLFNQDFIPNSSSELEFTIELPIEVGNEYQEQIASLLWIFEANSIPPVPVVPSIPDGRTVINSNNIASIINTKSNDKIITDNHIAEETIILDDSIPEGTTITDDPIPDGNTNISQQPLIDSNQGSITNIIDNQNPLQMPQTGEPSLMLNFVVGSLSVFSGLKLMKFKKN
jgi:hypothetical protein